MKFKEYLINEQPGLNNELIDYTLRTKVSEVVDTYTSWKQFQIESQYLIECLGSLITKIGDDENNTLNWIIHTPNFKLEFFSNFEKLAHCICYDTNINSEEFFNELLLIEENFRLIFDENMHNSEPIILIDKRELLEDYITEKIHTVYVIKY